MRNKLLLALLLSLNVLAFFPAPAQAAVPNTVITSVDIYQSVWTANDAVVLVYFQTVNWGTVKSGIAKFSTTNGATDYQIFSLSMANGVYVAGTDTNYNILAFRFAPGYAWTWGNTYRITIDGNPTLFVTPPSNWMDLAANNYHTATSVDDGRTQLQNQLISVLAGQGGIEQFSGIAAGTLGSWTTQGWKTTATGTALLLTALPDLQTPLPNLFASIASNYTFTNINTGTGQTQTDINTQAAGGELANLTTFGQSMGVGKMIGVGVAIALFILAFVMAINWGSYKERMQPLYAFMLSFPFLLWAMRASLIPMGYIFTFIYLCWLIGLFRFIRPFKETGIIWVGTLWFLGSMLGSFFDGDAIGANWHTVTNAWGNIQLFTQNDSSIIGKVFSAVIGSFQFIGSFLLQFVFWNYGFWNSDTGLIILKWMLWLPTAGCMIFMFISTALSGAK